MKTFNLKRFVDNEWGTFSTLYHEKFIATTLERSWQDNKPDVSCIPEGTYKCVKGQHPQHGETFEVTGVPARFGVLFHKGNYQTDSKGCILVGYGFGVLNGQAAITSSGQAFTDFLSYLKDDTEFELVIKNC